MIITVPTTSGFPLSLATPIFLIWKSLSLRSLSVSDAFSTADLKSLSY
ncbi:hypothetical protein ACE1AT_19645 [Pelatocladus sp. BLCC-F211]